jgi:hypothetical protein
MKNQSVSDFVAATMDAVLNSKEHKSLFDVQYKYAQDMNAAKDSCKKCGSGHSDKDSCMADDNDARKSKKDDEDESSAWDDNDARKKKDDEDDKKDDSDASDSLEPSVAFDVAIDSLLTASAALDQVGLERGSALVLKIASLTVEAKKKDKKDSQSAKDKKSDKKDSKKSDKKDSQSAKDKKSDKKDSKKDSKKDDKKSSKK